jgi:hypothetical protein
MAESDQPASQKKIYHGSCHCRAITYSVLYSVPSLPIATRCNCTICLKIGYTALSLDEQDFALITPLLVSELADYQWRTKQSHRYFCNRCGVHVYGKAEYEEDGKVIKHFGINLVTLDQPQEGLNLSNFKIRYYSGRNDAFHLGLKDTPYPGGCI